MSIIVPWIEDDQHEYCTLNPESDHFYPVRDPAGWWSAVIRHDGCVDVRRYFNVPMGDDRDNPLRQNFDQLHICEIDDLIQRLEALKIMAREHFGEDWE